MKKTFFLLILNVFCLLIGFAQNNIYEQNDEILNIQVVYHIVLDTKEKHDFVTNQRLRQLLVSVQKDFNAQNDGLEVIPKEFQDDIADCNINFELAKFDQARNPIQSISRHYTNQSTFSSRAKGLQAINEDEIKLKSYGHQDSNRFLNIWICDLEDNNFGYARKGKHYNPALDGVVIDYKTIPVSFSLTHEIGHYLNLSHLWGDSCWNIREYLGLCGDDGIEDTPKQVKESPYGCNPSSSCEGNGLANIQNFMDYAYCIGMFTHGQKAVMRNYIKQQRHSLLKKPINDTKTTEITIK